MDLPPFPITWWALLAATSGAAMWFVMPSLGKPLPGHVALWLVGRLTLLIAFFQFVFNLTQWWKQWQ